MRELLRGLDWVDVPATCVKKLEMTTVDVAAFSVSKRCISVDSFRSFVAATGYRTTAEQLGNCRTFVDNDLLIEMTPTERLRATAACISYFDAEAFCRWSGLRLPSEDEWLAASVMDWNQEYSDKDYLIASRRVLQTARALRYSWLEWTSTVDAATELRVLRQDPRLFLTHNWRRECRAILYPPEYCDLEVCFRCCRQ